MTDQEFLCWIHARLEIVHGENPLVDYMHKLRGIIGLVPKSQTTFNVPTYNSLEELQKELDRQ